MAVAIRKNDANLSAISCLSVKKYHTMSPTHHTIAEIEAKNRKLCQANAKVMALLDDATRELRAILLDECVMEETPLEAEAAMNSATVAIRTALCTLKSAMTKDKHAAVPPPGGPTRQQGQFLAFIRDYMMRNVAGVAPSHADCQRFFNLTPPSVNSMLIRLEQRGFIRRIPGKARALELTINPDWIPPLDRPFR
ncbi:MAG: hypothetical protein WC708_12615 [Lentisphaeria bacterium]